MTEPRAPRGGAPAADARRRGAAGALGAGVILCLLAGCGARPLTVGATPFPASRDVFADAEGRPLRDLPQRAEPLALVFLDFPWCPACVDAWEAVAAASESVAPGSVRIVRVLFDRERLLTPGKAAEVPPLRESRPPPDALRVPVTTLAGLPGPFREEYRLEQAPLLLLLDRGGTIRERWAGSSPSLGGAIAAGITSRSSVPPLPGR